MLTLAVSFAATAHPREVRLVPCGRDGCVHSAVASAFDWSKSRTISGLTSVWPETAMARGRRATVVFTSAL
eukprot:854273-Prymnesium_polylepis.1